MPSSPWITKEISNLPDAAAPDGAQVRMIGTAAGASVALFTLPPGVVARAVAHRAVDEIWYVTGGKGRLWRRRGADEEIAELRAGVALTIPAGTEFQFRNDGDLPLDVVGVTMPPWPGADEARPVAGAWPPTA